MNIYLKITSYQTCSKHYLETSVVGTCSNSNQTLLTAFFKKARTETQTEQESNNEPAEIEYETGNLSLLLHSLVYIHALCNKDEFYFVKYQREPHSKKSQLRHCMCLRAFPCKHGLLPHHSAIPDLFRRHFPLSRTSTYCRKVVVEYMHINMSLSRTWSHSLQANWWLDQLVSNQKIISKTTGLLHLQWGKEHREMTQMVLYGDDLSARQQKASGKNQG